MWDKINNVRWLEETVDIIFGIFYTFQQDIFIISSEMLLDGFDPMSPRFIFGDVITDLFRPPLNSRKTEMYLQLIVQWLVFCHISLGASISIDQVTMHLLVLLTWYCVHYVEVQDLCRQSIGNHASIFPIIWYSLARCTCS